MVMEGDLALGGGHKYSMPREEVSETLWSWLLVARAPGNPAHRVHVYSSIQYTSWEQF